MARGECAEGCGRKIREGQRVCRACGAELAKKAKGERKGRRAAGLCRIPKCKRKRYRKLTTCWQHARLGKREPRDGDDLVGIYFPSRKKNQSKKDHDAEMLRRYRTFRRV